jgi:Membrane domain of glycerophosphoryl diester phosphodiesterase
MLRAVTAPAPLRLRPLEVGDLLDETFRVYRRHFLLFAGISIILSIPQAAVSGYGYYSFLGAFTDQLSTGAPFDFTQLESSLGALAVGVVVIVLLSPFYYGAVTYATCQSAIGRSVTAGGVASAVLRRYFQLLAYVLAFYAMSVLFCLFPLWIWILIGCIVVMPVMFVEDTGLRAAMRRSWHLVQGRWWRTFLILLLTLIVSYFASLALGAFISLGQFLIEIVAAPAVAIAISTAIQEVVRSLVTPLFQIVIVLVYFDLRVRREGLDLFQLAQRVPVPPLAT